MCIDKLVLFLQNSSENAVFLSIAFTTNISRSVGIKRGCQTGRSHNGRRNFNSNWSLNIFIQVFESEL